MTAAIDFVTLQLQGRPLSIEYQWLGDDDPTSPLILFLHEGLGSLAMWKQFPAELCADGGYRGLVFSRPGYGRSTPRTARESWGVDFMHRQAYELLPALMEALQIDTGVSPPWLFGHSDGGSIALLYAARNPDGVAGAILLSPHIMVEDLTVESIRRAREAYLETDLKHRLARYHADPDSAFWGWNDIWLQASFRDWSIVEEIAGIRCPLLAVQGLDDEYGTLEQIHGIARRVAHAQLVELPDCGHSPQRDQPQELIRIATRFIADNSARDRVQEAGFCTQF